MQQAPSNSSIVQCIQLTGDLEHDNVKKLQEIAYYIAPEGQPFSNFKEQLKIAQMHMRNILNITEMRKPIKILFLVSLNFFLKKTLKIN